MSARIERHNGTPTLFVNDQPVFATYLWGKPPTAEGFELAECAARIRRGGHPLLRLRRRLARHRAGVVRTRAAAAPATTTSRPSKRACDTSSTSTPTPTSTCASTSKWKQWWQDLYPEECEWSAAGERQHQSFASTVWREQAKDFLRPTSPI